MADMADGVGMVVMDDGVDIARIAVDIGEVAIGDTMVIIGINFEKI